MLVYTVSIIVYGCMRLVCNVLVVTSVSVVMSALAVMSVLIVMSGDDECFNEEWGR